MTEFMGVLGRDGSTFDKGTEVLAIANAGAIASTSREIAGVFSHLYLDVDAASVITIPATETIVIKVSESEDGTTFADTRSLTITGATGGTVIPKYDKLFSYVPDNLSPQYSKITITSDFDATGMSIKVFEGRLE